MAITKCRIWVQVVNRFTVRRDVLRQCGLTSGGRRTGSGLKEQIMSKTNDTSKLASRDRELRDDELDAVSGGKQKPDGTAAGNVAAKWNVAQGAAA